MKKIKKHLIHLCAWVMSAVLLCGIVPFSALADNNQYGVDAYDYLSTLTQNFKNRVPGSAACIGAGDWIASVLSSFGYGVEKYEFQTNVYYADYCVTKQGTSNDAIYVVASYDSEDTLEGLENGSGVGVLLELAKRFADTETFYTIKFYLLGASEEPAANEGMRSLVQELMVPTGAEKTAVACIDLDDVAGGDHLYVYGGAYENNVMRRAWLSQMALDIANRMGVTLQTIPEDEEEIHAPEYLADDVKYWNEQKIAYVTFASGVWEDGEKITSTLPAFEGSGGLLTGTDLDQLASMESVAAGRMQYEMAAVSMVVSQMLREMNEDNLRNYGAEYLVGETEPAQTEETVEQTVEETAEETSEETQTAETVETETQTQGETESESTKSVRTDGVTLYNPFADTEKRETIGQIETGRQEVRTGEASMESHTEAVQEHAQTDNSFSHLFEIVMGIILLSIGVAIAAIFLILRH